MSEASNITLQTIADECGVSRTTASNAFSRPDQLSDGLRNRILETADRLGYTGPHPGARSLRRGTAGALGIVLKESISYALHDAHAVEFLGGLAEHTEDPPIALTLIPGGPIESDRTPAVAGALVDGFCLFSLPDGHPVITAVLARRLPTVFVDGPHVEGLPFVGIDDRAAMREMTAAVLDEGHRDIAVLTFRLLSDGRVGPVAEERIMQSEYGVSRNRMRGVIDATNELAIVPEVYEVGVNTRAAAQDAARQVLSSGVPPTAVICMSDQIAFGVLDVADELGMRVPDSLSVTGFDDVPEAQLAGITTIRQSATEKGRVVADLLTCGKPETVILPHRLVRRASLGPVPA